MFIPTRPYVTHVPVSESYARAMDALQEGEFKAAADLLEREPADSHWYVPAKIHTAYAYLYLERFETAEEQARSALDAIHEKGCSHPPLELFAYRALGESLIHQRRHEQAMQCLAKARERSERLISDFPELAADIKREKADLLNSWASALLHTRNASAALEVLREARALYGNQIDDARCSILLSMAHAYRLSDPPRLLEASLALREAHDVALQVENPSHFESIAVAWAQVGGSELDRPRLYVELLALADKAERDGLHSVATTRRGICAEIATDAGDYGPARDALDRALGLDDKVDPRDPVRAWLRRHQLRFLFLSGAPLAQQLLAGIEGGRLWFERLASDLRPGDLLSLNEELHDHCRLFARVLLDGGMAEQAVASFEAGRAVAHAVAVDRRFLDHARAVNPFSREVEVDVSALREIRARLADNEVVLVPVILPPCITAFVVARDDVHAVEVRLPDSELEQDAFFSDVGLIAARLDAGAGLRAIPVPVQKLCGRLRQALCDRFVVSIVPHSVLHEIPWRAALHVVGMGWHQLRAKTGFGLLLRHLATPRAAKRCIALGFGFTGRSDARIDLTAEAESFAREFGAEGRVVGACRPGDVTAALSTDATVLVSCHGTVRAAQDGSPSLFLDLEGGTTSAAELIPDAVRTPIAVLSACSSGVYKVAWGDFPVGAVAQLLRAGAGSCVCARFPVGAKFAASFFTRFARAIAGGAEVSMAVAAASAECEAAGFDLWTDVACIEVVAHW